MTLSKSYRLECGIHEGGLRSTTLFYNYINDLIVALSSARVVCHIGDVCVNNISYADDVVLQNALICGSRKLVKTCEMYAEYHGVIYNV